MTIKKKDFKREEAALAEHQRDQFCQLKSGAVMHWHYG